MEFMNAMQRFKESSGKSFPTHGEVLKVAIALGYRLAIDEPDPCRGRNRRRRSMPGRIVHASMRSDDLVTTGELTPRGTIPYRAVTSTGADEPGHPATHTWPGVSSRRPGPNLPLGMDHARGEEAAVETSECREFRIPNVGYRSWLTDRSWNEHRPFCVAARVRTARACGPLIATVGRTIWPALRLDGE